MGKKKKPKQRVTEYFTSIQYAICHGVVERLLSIRVNDKPVQFWDLSASSAVVIHRPEMFGGIRKEGGLSGRMAWQNGSDDQLLDPYVAAKKGTTPSNLPGYRGIATAFFTENPTVGGSGPGGLAAALAAVLAGRRAGPRLGFYWSANQPIIPPVHFQVTRIDRSWRPDIASIDRENAPTLISTSYSLNAAFPNLSFGQPGYPAMGTNYPNTLVIGPFPEYRQVIAGPSGARPDDRFVFNGTVLGDVNFVNYPPGTVFAALEPGQTLTVQIRNTENFNSGASGSLVAIDARPRPIDMNPAHIIRECLVNSVWGLGLPETALDNAMFEAAAETLFDERFGLSMIWTQQAEIQSFVGDVLSHIQGTVYVNPMSGKIALKLIRNDYDPETLPILDPSNCKVTTFKRRSPAEVTNEIAVTWTNPDTEEDEVVTMQSLGSIVANNGEIVSDNRNYYGVRRRDLAAELCVRDLAAATAPLATAEVVADRRFSRTVPGDVLKLTYPENGAFETVMRVLKVEYGRPGDSSVRLSLSEDVFSYEKPRVIVPPGSLNPNNPSVIEPPRVPTFVEPITTNAFMNQNWSDGRDDLDEPETQAMFIVATDNSDVISTDILLEEVLVSGATSFENIGEFSVVGRTLLQSPLPAEPESEVTLPIPAVGSAPVIGGFAVFGPDGLPEDYHEIALIKDFDVLTGLWTLARAALDTVPWDWPVGTPVRYFGISDRLVTPEAVTAGVSNDYKVLPRVPGDILAENLAAVTSYTPTERLYAPARPANVIVAGAAFGLVDVEALATINVSWATRNRLTEDQFVLGWTEASVPPEVGQTTTVRLIDAETDSIITEFAGLTGTSYAFPKSAVGGAFQTRVVVLSERDGIESIQGHRVIIETPTNLRVTETNNEKRFTETGDRRQTED